MVAPMRAVTSVMRVQQLWLSRLNDELKPFDLTFPRYEALMLLYFSRTGALPLGKRRGSCATRSARAMSGLC